MHCTHTNFSHKSAIHRQITILLTDFKCAKTWCNIQKTQLRPCFLFHSVFPWSITSVPSTACLQLQLKNTQWTPQSCAALSFCPTVVTEKTFFSLYVVVKTVNILTVGWVCYAFTFCRWRGAWSVLQGVIISLGV